MLKKLIKHDLKYGVRMFAVLHIILIIGCLMARFLVIDHLDFSADPEEFAPVIALLIVVLTMLFSAISFGCCIMYAVRFYKNLFTDEGYITWTLPASPLTQLWTKILSASIWYVLDLTICFAAAWFLISGDNIQSALERIKPDFQAALGMSFSSFCGLVVVFFICRNSFLRAIYLYKYCNRTAGSRTSDHCIHCCIFYSESHYSDYQHRSIHHHQCLS